MSISGYYPANIMSGSVTKVADATERLALSPVDGDLVIQLDTDTLYTYDGGTTSWVDIGSAGAYVLKAGDTMTDNLLFSTGKGIDSVVSGTTTLNIGANNADVINIGNGSATVNIYGTVNSVAVTNLEVTDKLITVNDGGPAASGAGSGIEVEENAVATGYIKVASDRNSWEFKAPNNAGVASIKTGTHNIVIDTSTIGSSTKTYSALNATGTMALTSAALTSGSVPYVTASGIITEDTANLSYNSSLGGIGLGIATASVAARVHIGGNRSAASWTTNGIGIRTDAATMTNSSSSGTVALQTQHSLGAPTFAASSSTTFTDACTFYIAAAPIAGTNVTITRPWTVYSPSGRMYISDGVNIGTTTQASTIKAYVATTGTSAAANAIYSQSSISISTSPASVQSACLTGDQTITGNANSTNTTGITAVEGFARSTGTATVTALNAFRTVITNTSTGTVTHAYHFRSFNATNSGGGTITNQYGHHVEDLTSATNNFAAHWNVSSGSNKWNLYALGTATNYMNGSVTIGSTTATAKFNVLSTTEQARILYDASNYYTTTVSSAGLVTLDAVGSSAGFQFSDRVIIPTSTPANASATGTAGHVAWDSDYIYICTASNTWKRAAIATW